MTKRTFITVDPDGEWQIKNWRHGNKGGEVIEDDDVFDSDEAVFAVAKKKEIEVISIKLTVEADSGYTFKETKKPCIVEIEKGQTWASVKTKVEAKIELSQSYEKVGWKRGGKDGTFLEDLSIFNEDVVVYATSRAKGSPEKPKVTIKVQGDAGVEVSTPDNFKVDSGAKWKDIKANAVSMTKAKTGFSIKSWHLKDESGEELQEAFEFTKNETIFAVSEKQKESAKYYVEHWQENIENADFTKIETEEKTGELGKNTEANAKIYDGFTAQAFTQSLIQANGGTTIKIQYKRNITSLILNLDGGKTATKLEDGADGNKLLKGKYGAKVSEETPTKDGVKFTHWEPALPSNFLANNEDTVYVAKWEATRKIKVNIKADERCRIIGNEYVYVNMTSYDTFSQIKDMIVDRVAFKEKDYDKNYEFYDFREDDEDGDEITDDSKITKDEITIYVRTNYKHFIIKNDRLVGYSGDKPLGILHFPEAIIGVEREAFKDCKDITGLDFSKCSKLGYIDKEAFYSSSKMEKLVFPKNNQLFSIEEKAFYSCGIKNLDLSKCTKLERIEKEAFRSTRLETLNLSDFAKLTEIGEECFSSCGNLKTINLDGCVELTEIGEKCFLECRKMTSIDLSPCSKLKIIKKLTFYSCYELKTVDLSGCSELKELEEECFKLCKNAEVKLPVSIKVIRSVFKWCERTYGSSCSQHGWCKKVLVPNEEIKNLVKNSGYNATIEIYTP
ncbi:MAG: leucine-rich repeat domain-containing protein [Treponema sp.]